MAENKLITVDFEGVNWNATHWATKTESDFTEEAVANGVYNQFAESEQKELIAGAWAAINEAVAGVPAPKKIPVAEKAKAESKVVLPNNVVVGPLADSASDKSEKPTG